MEKDHCCYSFLVQGQGQHLVAKVAAAAAVGHSSQLDDSRAEESLNFDLTYYDLARDLILEADRQEVVEEEAQLTFLEMLFGYQQEDMNVDSLIKSVPPTAFADAHASENEVRTYVDVVADAAAAG